MVNYSYWYYILFDKGHLIGGHLTPEKVTYNPQKGHWILIVIVINDHEHSDWLLQNWCFGMYSQDDHLCKL